MSVAKNIAAGCEAYSCLLISTWNLLVCVWKTFLNSL